MPPAWDEQLLQNPHAVADKRRRVQQMFAAIAPSYDLNNRLHSLWRDQAWRRRAVKLAGLKSTDGVVDVACGTGDLTLAFVTALVSLSGGSEHSLGGWSVHGDRLPPRAIGVDFTFEMLPIARSKTDRVHYFGADERGLWDGWRQPIAWLNGDAQSLPLPDQSADILSIAFGIRNVADPAAAIARILSRPPPRRPIGHSGIFPSDQSDFAQHVQFLFPPDSAAHRDADQRRQDRGI